MNNETLLSAIRLHQTPLIGTADFTKQDLFSWAKDVLDTPELNTVGEHMPFFFSSSTRAQQVMRRLFGIADISQLNMPSSHWRAPQNKPPPVHRAPAFA